MPNALLSCLRLDDYNNYNTALVFQISKNAVAVMSYNA